jgi:hypothetical protein
MVGLTTEAQRTQRKSRKLEWGRELGLIFGGTLKNLLSESELMQPLSSAAGSAKTTSKIYSVPLCLCGERRFS